jgi:hypothetical protein
MIQQQWTYIVWGLMALLLVGGGLVAAERRRAATGSRGPGLLASAAIWLGVIVLVILLYEGGAFWTALGSWFRG